MATVALESRARSVRRKTFSLDSMPKLADRMTVIAAHLPGRAVLDVGCVDSRPSREASQARIERKPDLLFQRILEINPQTLGADIDQAGIEMLAARGHRAVCGDAETMDLGQRFDTIVAGEIIEHLENPGRFLRNMRRHLHDDGVLLLSTPNPFFAAQTWKIWRYGRPSIHEDHTCWFDPITLAQLLARTGFEVSDGYWVQPAGKSLKVWRHHLRSYYCQSFLLVARPS